MTDSRAKGATGERELVQEFIRRGILCRRTAQHCGMLGMPDVQCDGLGLHVEVKRTEKLRIADAVAQCNRDARGKPWIIAYRSSRMPWLIIQTLDQFNLDSDAMRRARAHRAAIVAASIDPNESV